MRIPVRARESGMRFNITPLIDICFNLIVFFGLSSLYVKKETSQPITLPDAHQVDATNDSAFRRLIVTLDADRRMLVGGEKVTASEIDRRIRDGQEKARRFEVRIRADRAVPYEDVKPIILACARHGVTDLKFAVHRK